MHLRTTSDGTLIEQEGGWISLARALRAAGNGDPRVVEAATGTLPFLRADEEVRAQAAALVQAAADDPGVEADATWARLSFTPRSMRAFMLWESHVIGSSRMLVKNFFEARRAGRGRPAQHLRAASKGKRLDTGDIISTGTMPGCCGLELEQWIKPGQTVELEIDRIGTLSNRVSADARPTTAVPA